MEIHIISQGISDAPKLANLPIPIIDLTGNPSMTFCVIEKGMVSGDPSVIIVSSDNEGSVCLQTSLDKFISACSAMIAIAESKWNWIRQEGSFSILPPDNKTKKHMLEAIKKELEEWSDLDER